MLKTTDDGMISVNCDIIVIVPFNDQFEKKSKAPFQTYKS